MNEPKVLGLIPLRHFYETGKATRLGRVFSDFWAGWSAIGLPSLGMVRLEVLGRKTGKMHGLAVVVATVEGERYLVSMLGECEWVWNARANPCAAIVRFKRRPVVLEEVPVAERAPIIQVYLRRAPGGRPHIGLSAEASLADCERVAPRHPVFRIVGG